MQNLAAVLVVVLIQLVLHRCSVFSENEVCATYPESDCPYEACGQYMSESECPYLLVKPPPCHGHLTSSLKCNYIKGLPAVIPNSGDELELPGKAVNFIVSKYSFSPADDCQYTALNISWKLNTESGAIKFLKGFILRVISTEINITRFFNLTFIQWRLELEQVEIYYPCIITDYKNGAQYDITLQSVPFNNRVDNAVRFHISVPPNNQSNGSCYWTAEIAVGLFPCMVKVNFNSGPAYCNFSLYQVQLVRSGYHFFNNVANAVFVNASAEVRLTTVFMNVTAGSYDVWIEPVETFPDSSCICHDENRPEVCDHCPITKAGPFEVVCGVPPSNTLPPVKGTDTLRATTEPSTSTPAPTSGPPTAASIAGICVGLAVALIAVTALLVVGSRLCRGRPGQQIPPSSITDEAPAPNVWVVYLHDSAKHEAAIHKFSHFITSHSNCEVAEIDMPQASLLLSNQQAFVENWYRVNHVIVIYHDLPARDSLRPQYSAFVKVMEHFQRLEETCGTNKLIFVSFKITGKEEFAGVRTGSKFQLIHNDRSYLPELMKAVGGYSDDSCSGNCDAGIQLEYALFEIGLSPPPELSGSMTDLWSKYENAFAN